MSWSTNEWGNQAYVKIDLYNLHGFRNKIERKLVWKRDRFQTNFFPVKRGMLLFLYGLEIYRFKTS